MSLIAVGTIALDNVKTPSGEKKEMLGGSVAHFAMSARLFTRVHLAAIVGKDFPRKYIRFLEKKGVDLTSVMIGEAKTFRWHGEYKKDDLNTAITLDTILGVLMSYEPTLSEHQRSLPNIFLANIDPDIQMKVLRLMRNPRLVGLDSMNLWINHKLRSLLRLMRQVDVFVANDAEARAISGEHNLIQAAKSLRRLGPRFIVVKKGEHGVLFYSDQCRFSFPAYPVEHVVDPTGAGDTFAGGLMGYLSRAGRIDAARLKQAVLHATALASFNVEGFGMERTSRLTLPAVQRRVEKLVAFISL